MNAVLDWLAANTATTIVCPLTTGVIWRATADYYTASIMGPFHSEESEMSIHAVNLSPDDFARVFGATRTISPAGRSRLCPSCGDWHRLDRPWPHNCRPPVELRSDLSAPMLAPAFEPFMTGKTETAEYIGDRRDKREYMDRHELVEFDAGVKPDEVSERDYTRELVMDFKRAIEEDPLNRPPMERIGETDTEGAGEISVDPAEVAT